MWQLRSVAGADDAGILPVSAIIPESGIGSDFITVFTYGNSAESMEILPHCMMLSWTGQGGLSVMAEAQDALLCGGTYAPGACPCRFQDRACPYPELGNSSLKRDP